MAVVIGSERNIKTSEDNLTISKEPKFTCNPNDQASFICTNEERTLYFSMNKL